MLNPVFVTKDRPFSESVFHVVFRRTGAGHMVAFEAKSLNLAKEWIIKKKEYMRAAKTREIVDAEKLEGEERERLLEMIEGWYPEPVYEIVEEQRIYKVVE